MIENLVIVESPAKAKTIERFLGENYVVKSSFGHIRDLEKKDLGIDIEHNFQPKYEISPDKKAIVKELKQLAKEAKTVWLASDEDREGDPVQGGVCLDDGSRKYARDRSHRGDRVEALGREAEERIDNVEDTERRSCPCRIL